MAIQPGTRVKVYSGDQQHFLGYGQYLGKATTFSVLRDDDSLLSLPNPEERPSDEVIGDDELVVDEDNPKIQLDNGEVVYGCQVWWRECPEELN